MLLRLLRWRVHLESPGGTPCKHRILKRRRLRVRVERRKYEDGSKSDVFAGRGPRVKQCEQRLEAQVFN